MPTRAAGESVRGSGRKTIHRVGNEYAGADIAQPVHSDEQRAPGPSSTGAQDAAPAHGSGNRKQAGNDEVCDLDPSQWSVAEQAEVVTPEVESRPREHF